MSRRRVDEELTPEQLRLAPLVDEVVDGRPSTSGPASFTRLAEAAARRRARRSTARWMRLVPAAASILGGAVLCAHLTGWRPGAAPAIEAPAAEPLAYSIDGRPASAGGYVEGAGGTGTAVRFSDGTRFVFRPSGTGRIVSATPRGARVILEEGAVRVDVVPRANARWSIEAGPYVVEVKGTRFELAWSRALARLEVELHEGQVEVSGPRLGTGVSVRAGERLQADADGLLRGSASRLASARPPTLLPPAAVEPGLRTPPARGPRGSAERSSSGPRLSPARRGSPRTAAAPAEGDASGGGGGAPPDAVAPTTPAIPALLPPAVDAGTVREAWASLVRRGAFREVVDAVERLGVEVCLATCPIVDLVAAADAARYSGRWALAERALHAVRRRAAGEEIASTAAFFLGRLLAQRGDRAEALAWFARYEEEAPSGPYSALALGHRLALAAELGDVGTARALALSYLERHPEGAHAAQARRIVEGR